MFIILPRPMSRFLHSNGSPRRRYSFALLIQALIRWLSVSQFPLPALLSSALGSRVSPLLLLLVCGEECTIVRSDAMHSQGRNILSTNTNLYSTLWPAPVLVRSYCFNRLGINIAAFSFPHYRRVNYPVTLQHRHAHRVGLSRRAVREKHVL